MKPRTSRRSLRSLCATSAVALLSLCLGASAAEQWSYSENRDEMRGSSVHLAEINSVTRISQGIGQPLALTILVRRPMAAREDDVILGLRNGQFGCGVTNCSATVKFGDAAPKTYKLERSVDVNTSMVFVERAADFLAQARKANTAIIEVDVFRGGRQQFRFELPPLTLPDRPQKKK